MQLLHLLSILLVVPSALVLSAPVRVPESVESLYSRAVSVTVEAGPKGDFQKFSEANRPKECPPNAKAGQRKQHEAMCANWEQGRANFLATTASYKADIETLLNSAQAGGVAVPNTLTVYLQSKPHDSRDPRQHVTAWFKDASLCVAPNKDACVLHVRPGGTGQLYGGNPHTLLHKNDTPRSSPAPGSPKKRSPSPAPKGGKK